MLKRIMLAGLVMAGPALAQTVGEVTAWTDLNLRAGPGPGFAIVTVIPAQSAVTVAGCLAEQSWCRVNFDGQEGWASGDYLTITRDEAPVAIYPLREELQVQTLTYEGDEDTNALAGGTLGAIAGAVIAGPLGAAVGGALGAASGAAATPDTTVTTYVTQNPVAPVYLEGEVVTGARLPEVVEVTPVPDSPYAYAYVNGVPVLVEQGQRQIIYIVR